MIVAVAVAVPVAAALGLSDHSGARLPRLQCLHSSVGDAAAASQAHVIDVGAMLRQRQHSCVCHVLAVAQHNPGDAGAVLRQNLHG